MTQSGQNKKPQQKVVEVTKEEAPLDEYSQLIEKLKKEKPAVYETFQQAAKAGKRVKIGDDLSLRIG